MPPRERVGGTETEPPYSLAGSHQKPPPPVPVLPLATPSHRGVRLTLYRAKERGRQVLPPSFPSATLEIYYADSGGAAVGRGEAIPEEGTVRGGYGNLKLYLPHAPNDFSPPSVPFLPLSFVDVHPPDVCTGFAHSLLGTYLFSYSYANGITGVIKRNATRSW